MLNQVALVIDILITAFVFGATVWFFFVQSPALLKWLGKEKFIPIQMRVTSVFFKTLSIVVPMMFAMTLVHGRDQLWTHILTAGVAMFGALVNALVVIPRALKAGGKAMRGLRDGEKADESVTGFASDGAGNTTSFWHRLVVLFVVVMMVGLVSHGVVIVRV